MQFEWDEDKRLWLLERRGFDLIRAARIFRGPIITKRDARTDYGEDRYISIRKVEEDYFVVIHTPRQNVVRLVTAWRAGRRARRQYQARFP